jgi:putative PIN family toxin of toxin-antitoxin system
VSNVRRLFVVIDTNVLVSAMIKYDSNPGQVIEFAFKGEIIPVLNEQILSEYKEVLARPKFQLTEELISFIIDGIVDKAVMIEAEEIKVDMPDPKDVIFYAVTMETRKLTDTYLVTGNLKHFPSRSFIVTPKQLLEVLALQR